MMSMVWPLGRVVKEDLIASFRRDLAALLAEEAECEDCHHIRQWDGKVTPPLICSRHHDKRNKLAGF